MNIQRYCIGVKYRGTGLCGFVKSSHNPLPSVESLVSGSLDGFLQGSGSGSGSGSRSGNGSNTGDSEILMKKNIAHDS